ncbi:DUF6909 family protein [Moheibacter stercoris]|uniref:Uncharacterized protein n=1 Tax=Moheibacter stercoris TaxID=1628251 RepID=A0ABV2LS79_9FLAO
MIQNVTRARQSTTAIDRLYITMRHMFHRGTYRPTGQSGKMIQELLLQLNPEIYGSMADPEKVELDGLFYVLDRLPDGITETPYIHFTSNEGVDFTKFKPIIPPKRRRICYRVDEDQMNIEVTRGRSEIYDTLTHLTFLYNESDKIRERAFNKQTQKMSRVWQKIEEIALSDMKLSTKDRDVALMHLSTILGRTYNETVNAYKYFSTETDKEKFFKIIYWMGQTSQQDFTGFKRREITFSPILRERIGHHMVGEKWANTIKKTLSENGLMSRPLHIISANMHSVSNMVYAFDAMKLKFKDVNEFDIYKDLSSSKNKELRDTVSHYSINNGMIFIPDTSGTNIDIQIIDLKKVDLKNTAFSTLKTAPEDVLIVMDYAFGEQAFEVMDELLKPYKSKGTSTMMNVHSVSIMGKAGILTGKKGDIMVPTSHVIEGPTDNYVFKNELTAEDFKGSRLGVYEGPMITVLGTSLQNKDVLEYFKDSSWSAIGLEMEGGHYQKAIQIASKIRHHISPDVKVLYAYYASDNPLETGSTLASGGLGLTGVKPTYLITKMILKKILGA